MVLDEVLLVSSLSIFHALLNRLIFEASEIFAVFKTFATLGLFWPFLSVSLAILKMVLFKSLAKLLRNLILLGSPTAPGLLIEIMFFIPRQRNIFCDLCPTALCFFISHVYISLGLPINSAILPFKILTDPFFERHATTMVTNM